MSLSKVYLTIDDSPSIHTDKKILFLKNKDIPAILYARGEYVKKYPKQIINAIKNGFLIGNHSYTHPYFYEITLSQCFDEILLTENLINECYRLAQTKRPCKIVRLPFADRGAGPKARVAREQSKKTKVKEIQSFV